MTLAAVLEMTLPQIGLAVECMALVRAPTMGLGSTFTQGAPRKPSPAQAKERTPEEREGGLRLALAMSGYQLAGNAPPGPEPG